MCEYNKKGLKKLDLPDKNLEQMQTRYKLNLALFSNRSLDTYF